MRRCAGAFLAVLLLALQGCGGGGGGSAPQAAQACSVADQRATLDAWLQSQYLWNTQLQPADTSAATLDAYFQSRLWRPTDRYSYSQPTASYQQTFSIGYRYGWGYVLAWGDAAQTQLRVRNVEPQGPAAAAGLKRGDIILSIDGHSPAEIVAGATPGVDTAGVPRVFQVQDAATGAVRSFTAVSADYPLTPLAQVAVLDGTRAGVTEKVGYMAYHQFVSYSGAALQAAVQQFVDAGVRDLVLDLRYNGGGAVSVSRDLASLIGGTTTDGQRYVSLHFNELQQAQNEDIPFSTPADRSGPALQGLDRLVVIASGATASASELLVNGLRPYMRVVLVGETTYGKPYGFVPRSYCGTTYDAVNFEAVNALGVGGYTQGLAPDCAVPDDLDHALGDPAERRTQVALTWLATGSCGPLAQAALARAPRRVPAAALPGEQPPPGMFR